MRRLIWILTPMLIAGILTMSLLHPWGTTLTPVALAQETKEIVVPAKNLVDEFCQKVQKKLAELKALQARLEETGDVSAVIEDATIKFREHMAYFAELLQEAHALRDKLEGHISQLATLSLHPKSKVNELRLRKAQVEGEIAVLKEKQDDPLTAIRIQAAERRRAIIDARIKLWERLIPIQEKLLATTQRGLRTVENLIVALEEYVKIAEESFHALSEGGEILAALDIYSSIPQIEDLVDFIMGSWQEVTSLVNMLLEAAAAEAEKLVR